ncbi:MAG: amidohydrolase family protein, partial [Bacillota bacterium]|nr:amidohydrolase family protein [Bacillota bacterium]
CYQFPTRTITDSCRDDIILIDKIIGAGEIAISDHRSSNPLDHDIENLASECRVGGLLSGKAGILHIHVGDDPEGIKPLFRLANRSQILLQNILPTHLNRKMPLLYEGMKYLKKGGIIDITSGIFQTEFDTDPIDASYAFKYLLENKCPKENITISSDSNGSMPIFQNGILKSITAGSINTNFIEFKKLVQLYNFPIETALLPFTENPARILKFNNLGSIEINKQADILILNKDLTIYCVICKGKVLLMNGKFFTKSFF